MAVCLTGRLSIRCLRKSRPWPTQNELLLGMSLSLVTLIKLARLPIRSTPPESGIEVLEGKQDGRARQPPCSSQYAAKVGLVASSPTLARLQVALHLHAARDSLVMVVVAASFYTSFSLHVSSPFWFVAHIAAPTVKTQLTARLSHYLQKFFAAGRAF
jgi:hypothetical protein